MAEKEDAALVKDEPLLPAVPTYKGPQFLILRKDPDDLRELFEENLDDADEFDLESISIPGGGALTWQVSDVNGEPKSVDEIRGVVLLKGTRRAYWEKSFDESGGGSPPDCSSLDAQQGMGYIRGDDRSQPAKTRDCRTCPMAQWGSKHPDDPEDNQQACARRTLLMICDVGDVIPSKVDLAPTSVKPFKQFMARLTKADVRRTSAVVGLKLVNDRSRTGIKYSVVAARCIGKLEPEEAAKMRAFAEAIEPIFKRTGISRPAQDLVDQDVQRAQARAAADAERDETVRAQASVDDTQRDAVNEEELFDKE